MKRVPRVLISLSGPFTISDRSAAESGTPSCRRCEHESRRRRCVRGGGERRLRLWERCQKTLWEVMGGSRNLRARALKKYSWFFACCGATMSVEYGWLLVP